MAQLWKFILQKLLFFDLSVAKICSAKIFAREYYALKEFAVSNESALNLQGFFNLYFLCICLLKDYLLFCPGGKNTDGGRANIDENKLDFPDPDREV